MKALFFASLSIFTTSILAAADVEVIVDGVDEVKGKLLIGFYDNSKDFRVKELKESPAFQVTAAGRIIAVAKGLKPGTYAVAVIWDQNENGVLDVFGPFKVPTEPYGFSQNPKLKLGPPKFKDCTFVVTETGGTLHVVLK